MNNIYKIYKYNLACCDVIIDNIFLVVMDTAAPEHEAVHAHAQVLALSLETLPDKHAGTWHT